MPPTVRHAVVMSTALAMSTPAAATIDLEPIVHVLATHEAASTSTAVFGGGEVHAMSSDGSSVLLIAPNRLVTDVGGIGRSLYLWRRASNTSQALATFMEGNSRRAYPVFDATMTADARFIVFSSAAAIVPGQVGNGVNQLFRLDRDTGAVTLVTHAASNPLASANDVASCGASTCAISASGRFTAFNGGATNLVTGFVDANALGEDVFLHDATTGNVTLVTRASGTVATGGDGASWLGGISSDGRYITFSSQASNLVPGQVDDATSLDVFAFDRVTGTTTLLSARAGSPVHAVGGLLSRTSGDGGTVVIDSAAVDLVAGQIDLPDSMDVFLADVTNGVRTLVSHHAGTPLVAAGRAQIAAINGDGARVVIETSHPASVHVAGAIDTNGVGDALVWDRDARTFTLALRTSAMTPTAPDAGSRVDAISGDGRRVSVRTMSTDVGASGVSGHFIVDVPSGRRVLANGRRDAPSTPCLANDGPALLSADGATVARHSDCTALTADDYGTTSDAQVIVTRVGIAFSDGFE